MSEMIFIFVVLFFFAIFVGVSLFLIKQNQRSSDIWRQEIANLRLEFEQHLQGTIQNINSQIQNVSFQLNQKLDNSIFNLSSNVNSTISQVINTVTNNLQTINESTGQVSQNLSKATEIISNLMKQIGEVQEGANQIKSIGQSIAKLEDLLISPKFRGGFGERMLETMIKDMLPKEYYEFQFEFNNKKRVDAIVKISNKILPIDAKFPLDNYRKISETTDESEKKKRKNEFIKDIKKRASEIAENYIRPEENTLEFAMMYIPSEAVYYEMIADEEIYDVIEDMFKKKVIPVSPSILYIQLSILFTAIKAIQIEKNVEKIIGSLDGLSRTFSQIMGDFETLGRHINSAKDKYSNVAERMRTFESSLKQISQGTTSPELTATLFESKLNNY